MALFSTVIVWCGGTPAARAAGIRYAIMHLLGGVILKVGIAGVVVSTGSVDIRPFLATDFDTWMILIGLLINAAAPPASPGWQMPIPNRVQPAPCSSRPSPQRPPFSRSSCCSRENPVLIGVGCA
ncbi:MAG: hypothetical protein U5O39_20175 [Gammaproteobacteria bacterium]|nr:hypothetical protein [Gammaproteobacteria bacterium]